MQIRNVVIIHFVYVTIIPTDLIAFDFGGLLTVSARNGTRDLPKDFDMYTLEYEHTVNFMTLYIGWTQ